MPKLCFKNLFLIILKRSFLALLVGFAPTVFAAETNALTSQQTEFFEKKIRPLLVENCYKCHSRGSEKVKGGLLLDTQDGLLKGGDSGPALIAGFPDRSLIIQAVRYTNKDLQMPPAEQRLENSQISDLETWVQMGAPDPRTSADDSNHKYVADFEKLRNHWSFQPIRKPALPLPADAQGWEQSPVDNFILSQLQVKNLTPSPCADKVTLLRRATFDLIGLPPSSTELDNFLADDSTNAFAKVIERLLASPHYGERWGRHWLDIAHFSDTKGAIGNGRDERYPFAYAYRDYVIRSFNEDLPYNQFIVQQIAADRLLLGSDKRPLAAMGFLTLGNRALALNDIIDDRIDIISKGTMALTVTCARCHDHKFDPIPTVDYYALHGVFNSSTEPTDEPLLETPKDTAAYRDFRAEYALRQSALKQFHDEIDHELKVEMIGKAASYMMAIHDFKSRTNDLSLNVFMDKRGLYPQLGRIWEENMKYWAKRPGPVFTPWFAFAELDSTDFAAKAKPLAAKFSENKEKGKPINPLIARMFATPPTTLNQVAARYASVFSDIDQRWDSVMASYRARQSDFAVILPEPKGLPDPAQEQIRQVMFANNSPMLLTEQRSSSYIQRDGKLRNKLNELDRKLNDLIVTNAGSPPRAVVLQDSGKPQDSYVMIKGNPGNRGPKATRHFLSILSTNAPAIFRDGSGRLELARDIASKDNPLTSRVIVNRIWLYHFGEGIVRTPDDFGTRGDTPSHPELLDYLASRFIEGGWSIKQMHRLIMLSSTYQQSSDENPHYEQIDPENRWLWRMNRRRLDFEALRDTVLAIGGDLDLSMGGRPVKLDAEPYSLRRTVYGLVDRRNIPNMYQAFDFASPDLTTGKRENTVVPQQALFMMNNSLVVEQARNVVRRTDFRAQGKPEARIEMLYKLIYQRSPTETEMNLALDYIRSDYAAEWQTRPQMAWEYGFGTYDAAQKKMRQFVPMGNFANRSWQPGGKNPDSSLRGLGITAEGGSPNKNYAVVRRWNCPRDGFISITGNLTHGSKDGDGVQGHLVSSRSGELGTWTAFNNKAPTTLNHVAVKHGETLDFITDGRTDPRNDNFRWYLAIKMEPMAGLQADAIVEWNAQQDFSGEVHARPMTAWEKFAQVLLETNELTFIN